MEDICYKYASFINIKPEKLFFLYEGKLINNQLTFNEQAKEPDKKTSKMNILVYQNEHYNYNETKKYENSKDIICPKCGEILLFLIILNYLIIYFNFK